MLLVQTGGRTYSEGLTLRWDQLDLIHGVLHLGGSVKTTDSAQPLPLKLACRIPIYNLRHVFCTRLSWVAPDAVVQRAMRHSSPETKRHYQLGMVDQVRAGIEQANQRAYQGKEKVLRFYYGEAKPEKGAARKSVRG